MIQIARVTNPAEVSELLPHVTLPDPEGRELFGQQLVALMTQRPEAILVLTALRDSETLVGFVIADIGPGDTIFLRQAWISKDVSWDVGTELNARLKLWAVGHGRTKIEVRTSRNAEAMYRRFGFEEAAKILVQTIPDEFTRSLIDSVKEPVNG